MTEDGSKMASPNCGIIDQYVRFRVAQRQLVLNKNPAFWGK